MQEYTNTPEEKCSCNSLNRTSVKKYLFGTKASYKLDSYEEMPQFSVDWNSFESFKSFFPRHSYKDSETIFILRTLSWFQQRKLMSPPQMPSSSWRSCPARRPGYPWSWTRTSSGTSSNNWKPSRLSSLFLEKEHQNFSKRLNTFIICVYRIKTLLDSYPRRSLIAHWDPLRTGF